MTLRIHDSVIRGEIENLERGRIRGKIWLCGVAEPIELDLVGNACADLAGCSLTFENPLPPLAMRGNFVMDPTQRGTVGDFTASRKIRVVDLTPFDAPIFDLPGKRASEHLTNTLYLEWFSDTNGRVVIESADYHLVITPPAWRLTSEEERQRQQTARDGFSEFLAEMGKAASSPDLLEEPGREWDEFDYERFLRETDKRNDIYAELLDKYRDHPDRDRIVAREMGWTGLEEALCEQDSPANPEEKAALDFEQDEPESNLDEAEEGGEEFGLELDPTTEGIDWVRTNEGRVQHPLAMRASDGSVKLWRRCTELGLGGMNDVDLAELMSEYHITAAKLAGALNSLGYGRHTLEPGFIIACLKRALQHLHAAQAALEATAEKNLLHGETVKSTRAELFAVREEILRLMNEFRGMFGTSDS